jgi:predicted transcriptional regulator
MEKPWVPAREPEGKKPLEATSLGASSAGEGGKKFKGFTSMSRYRQGIVRALRYLASPSGSTVSNRIMSACGFSGDQHRAVLDYLLEQGFLKERVDYKRGQARYEAGPKLEQHNKRNQL